MSNAVLRWLKESGIETALIDPGRPWQSGADESFTGKFRDECLNLEWFRDRVEARVIIEQWRQHYNADQPHSSLGYRTPVEFMQQMLPPPRMPAPPGELKFQTIFTEGRHCNHRALSGHPCAARRTPPSQ